MPSLTATVERLNSIRRNTLRYSALHRLQHRPDQALINHRRGTAPLGDDHFSQPTHEFHTPQRCDSSLTINAVKHSKASGNSNATRWRFQCNVQIVSALRVLDCLEFFWYLNGNKRLRINLQGFWLRS